MKLCLVEKEFYLNHSDIEKLWKVKRLNLLCDNSVHNLFWLFALFFAILSQQYTSKTFFNFTKKLIFLNFVLTAKNNDLKIFSEEPGCVPEEKYSAFNKNQLKLTRVVTIIVKTRMNN